MNGWAEAVLDPVDADGESTLALDDLHRRALAEAEDGLDAAIAALGLDAEHAKKLRASMLAKKPRR
jgi:hypothetical protein